MIKVDRSKARTVLEEYEYLTEKLIELSCHIPWDTPANVQKCRDISYTRLMKKLWVLVKLEEAQEENLKVHTHLY